MLAVAIGAACVGSVLGPAAGLAARILGARPMPARLAAGCGAVLALLTAAALPAASWPAAAVFGTLLLAIAWLDLQTGLVHAALALPLALAGLATAALSPSPDALPAALAGMAIGYGGFVAVEWAFRRLRGQEGLGRGDAWVLGAAGAWVGPGGLGLLVALAAAAGLATVLVRDRGLRPGAALPFAPALAAAAWVVWIAAGGAAVWMLP